MPRLKSPKQKHIIIFLFIFWVVGICSLVIAKYLQTTHFSICDFKPVSEFSGCRIKSGMTSSESYPELQVLAHNTLTYQQLSTYFTKLAQMKGGVYAYQILKQAYMPPNTDLHLLGHIIGDQLYKQQGIQGMEYCTQDFRNACSHSIVVGTLLEYGPTKKIFDQIDAACKKAPGGYDAYTLCYHGLGHGVLAYTNYDMEKAAILCEKTIRLGKTKAYAECISGTVMEIIGGGFHDKVTWKKQSDFYFSNPNPLSLCQSPFIKPEAQYLCYSYLTPHLFTAAGFRGSNTHDPVSFQKAFTYCDQLPTSDTNNRKACFGGFGKEFVVLAKERDIRTMADMTKEQLLTTYDWCALANPEEGKIACWDSALRSLIWGGTNQPDAAVKFCSIMPHEKEQEHCFTYLFSIVTDRIKKETYQKRVCALVPLQYKKQCKN